MRTRKEIMKNYQEVLKDFKSYSAIETTVSLLKLEVLLDIRDLLKYPMYKIEGDKITPIINKK